MNYGESFADVYDAWYGEPSPSPTAETVATLIELAGPGPVLELGVGTGRLALPLAAAGLAVHGIDNSPEMLDVLRAKTDGNTVSLTTGDMASDLPSGPFTLVVVAFNTIFNLTSSEAQQRCFDAVHDVLTPDGTFVVEAFVPNAEASEHRGPRTEIRKDGDRTIAIESVSDGQVVSGRHVEFVDGRPDRLRPWTIRWATPEQLDTMAFAAGFTRHARWSNWRGETFTDESVTHVTLYRPA